MYILYILHTSTIYTCIEREKKKNRDRKWAPERKKHTKHKRKQTKKEKKKKKKGRKEEKKENIAKLFNLLYGM